jgi:hypothetical protein
VLQFHRARGNSSRKEVVYVHMACQLHGVHNVKLEADHELLRGQAEDGDDGERYGKEL